jgi:proliferating cell nuclear antigen
MDEEDEDTVLFTFESIEDGRKVTEFRLGLINMETRHLAIPDIEYPATVTMPSDGFQRIVRCRHR